MKEVGVGRCGPGGLLGKSVTTNDVVEGGFRERDGDELTHRRRGSEHAVFGVRPAAARWIEVADTERVGVVVGGRQQRVEILHPHPAAHEHGQKEERSQPPEQVPTHR